MSRRGDSLVYNCYRASCGCRGVCGERLVRPPLKLHIQQPRKQKEPEPFTGELEELDEDWRQYLRSRIGWEDRHVDLGRAKYAPAEGRIAYPIYGPMGTRRGWTLRSYSGDTHSKSYTRMDVAEPHLSWYRLSDVPGTRGAGILVEDIPSAVRAAFYWPTSIAMCGGGIGPDYVGEIVAHGVRHITWAFDNDATAAAIKHHRTYGLFFESSRVLALPRDLKDMKEDELCAFLRTNIE